MMWKPIAILPLGFSSFHQVKWVIFTISAWIHLWGWLTGSDSSGIGLDSSADGQAGMLVLAPPVEVELHWGPSLSSKGRPWWICMPCCSGDKSIGSLDGLSFSQEESHAWGQWRFTIQLVIYVKPDLFLWFLLNWGGGPALPYPASGFPSSWL